MDIASLLLGIGALFPACVQTYKTLAFMQSFSKEASALNWKLKTQELRFTTWGQACGFKDVDP
jgi:Prion-inhibition and propagation